ncbi:unnamed protein product [Lathyrus oleraceus]
MEILNLKEHRSQIKVISIVVCIAGALTVTLYKGMPLLSDAYPNIEMEASGINISEKSDWIVGAFLLATACFLLSLVIIVQTWIIKDYPEELLVTTLLLFCGNSIFHCSSNGRGKLKLDKKLVSVCYSAIFVVSTRNVVSV